MDNVNNVTESPWDLFLFPVWVHKKFSVSIKSLLPAFLFVGVFDMAFSNNLLEIGIFKGDVGSIVLRLLAFLVLSMVIGTIDVICTMVPIAEFSVMIGKRSEKYVSKRMPVILMKSYAISHILFIVPTAIYVYSGIDWANINMGSSDVIRLMYSVLLVISLLLPYLQLGIIYRTIGVRTRLQFFEKLILIFTTYFWMQLSGGAIIFIEEKFGQLLTMLS